MSNGPLVIGLRWSPRSLRWDAAASFAEREHDVHGPRWHLQCLKSDACSYTASTRSARQICEQQRGSGIPSHRCARWG